MDQSDIKRLEGKFVYFSGDTFGARGTVFDGNCYKFESFYDEDRVGLTLLSPDEINGYHVIEVSSPFAMEEAAIEVLANGRFVRVPSRQFEVKVPRQY